MENTNNFNYLLSDLTKLTGVGKKTMEILKKKKINNIFDLLWRLPKSYTDRTHVSKICDLQIGVIQTIRIVPLKYDELIILCNFLDIDDENLYNLNQGKPITNKIDNNKITELFKRFVYRND